MTRRHFAVFAAFTPWSLLAGTPVYPTPVAMTETGGTVTLSSSALIVGAEKADPDAVALLRARLARCPSSGDILRIVVGEKGEPAVAGFDADLPAVSGAYRIRTLPGKLVIVGADARGTFYAMQTLRQLLDADANPADMPAVSVDDAPLVPFRGAVEGFYGIPGDCWDHEGRLSLIAFMGRWKMDSYIYGPKDDPYHRSAWRKPYPAAESEHIRELVTASRANKVDFVWAVHPGGDIRWTEEDYLAAKSKFEDMYRLGVRTFAVFFDDIGGEGTRADKQASMLNRLDREFVKAKGDVSPLILCPTQYNKSWADPKRGGYLDVLGETLDPSVRVMWTGNTVVADLDKASMEYINARLRRKAWVWWNAPCNDFSRTNLSMGPVYADAEGLPAGVTGQARALGQRIFGNTAGAAALMSGFTSNPMGRSEASKVGLYGVAGYTWNPAGYDALKAWEGAMTEIMPEAAAAFRTFCEHNRDNGPNGHGYRRPESTAIKPAADAFLAAVRAGKPDAADAATLRAEFVRIGAAPDAIRAGADNPALIKEIGPWLDAFACLGRAGANAVDAASAETPAARWTACAAALKALAAQAEVSRTSNRNPWQSGVRTGTLVLAPLVDELVRRTGARLLAEASGRGVAAPEGESNSNTRAGLDRMTDGDAATYFYSEQNQNAGDWFGVRLAGPESVSRVSILMGRKTGDHDIVYRGQFEYSPDGSQWRPLGEPTEGESPVWEGPAVQAVRLRYRVLVAGSPDGKRPNVWTAVREFRVNPPASPPRVATNVPSASALPVRTESGVVSLPPQFEVFSFAKGAELGVEFPTPVAVTALEADLHVASPAKWAGIEITEDGAHWRPLKPVAGPGSAFSADIGAAVRGVRLRNKGGAAEARLDAFRLKLAPGARAGSVFADGDLSTDAVVAAKTVLDVPPGATRAVLFPVSGDVARLRIGFTTAPDGPVTSAVAVVPAEGLPTVVVPPGAKCLVLAPAAGEVRLAEVVWSRR